jgi:hypothetical protein
MEGHARTLLSKTASKLNKRHFGGRHLTFDKKNGNILDEKARLERTKRDFRRWLSEWKDAKRLELAGKRVEGSHAQLTKLLSTRGRRLKEHTKSPKAKMTQKPLLHKDGSELQIGDAIINCGGPFKIENLRTVKGQQQVSVRHVDGDVVRPLVPKGILNVDDSNNDITVAGTENKKPGPMKSRWFPLSWLFECSTDTGVSQGFGDQLLTEEEWSSECGSSVKKVSSGQDVPAEEEPSSKTPTSTAQNLCRYPDFSTQTCRAESEPDVLTSLLLTHVDNDAASSALGRTGQRAKRKAEDKNAKATRKKKTCVCVDSFHACHGVCAAAKRAFGKSIGPNVPPASSIPSSMPTVTATATATSTTLAATATATATANTAAAAAAAATTILDGAGTSADAAVIAIDVSPPVGSSRRSQRRQKSTTVQNVVNGEAEQDADHLNVFDSMFDDSNSESESGSEYGEEEESTQLQDGVHYEDDEELDQEEEEESTQLQDGVADEDDEELDQEEEEEEESTQLQGDGNDEEEDVATQRANLEAISTSAIKQYGIYYKDEYVTIMPAEIAVQPPTHLGQEYQIRTVRMGVPSLCAAKRCYLRRT